VPKNIYLATPKETPDMTTTHAPATPRTWNGRRYLVSRTHADACHGCDLAEVTAMALAAMAPGRSGDASYTLNTAADEWADDELHTSQATVVPEPEPEPLTNTKLVEDLMAKGRTWLLDADGLVSTVTDWEALQYRLPHGFTTMTVTPEDDYSGHTHRWQLDDRVSPWELNAQRLPVALSVYGMDRYRFSEAEGGCYTTRTELLGVLFVERGAEMGYAEGLALLVADKLGHCHEATDVDDEVVVGARQSVGSVYYC
jgi:hypothetical protein